MVATREQFGSGIACEKPRLPRTPRSARERFLHSGLRNFRAGALVGKSASSAQSVDQDSEPGIWNLEGTERAALPPYSNSQLLTPSFPTPPFASEVYPDDLIYSCDIGMPLCLGGENQLSSIEQSAALPHYSNSQVLGSRFPRSIDGNNGRYHDAATGRFLSKDPTKEGQNSESAASGNSNSQLLTPDS